MCASPLNADLLRQKLSLLLEFPHVGMLGPPPWVEGQALAILAAWDVIEGADPHSLPILALWDDRRRAMFQDGWRLHAICDGSPKRQACLHHRQMIWPRASAQIAEGMGYLQRAAIAWCHGEDTASVGQLRSICGAQLDAVSWHHEPLLDGWPPVVLEQFLLTEVWLIAQILTTPASSVHPVELLYQTLAHGADRGTNASFVYGVCRHFTQVELFDDNEMLDDVMGCTGCMSYEALRAEIRGLARGRLSERG